MQMTYWTDTVRLAFNPSEMDEVNIIKSAYANILDLLNDMRQGEENKDKIRLLSIAITETEGACMRAVKAATTLKN